MVNNASNPPVSQLYSALSRGPLWIAFEGGDFQHAVVATAIRGDRTEDGTVLRIHDPWPPGHGTVHATTCLRGRVNLRSVQPAKAAMIQYMAQP